MLRSPLAPVAPAVQHEADPALPGVRPASPSVAVLLLLCYRAAAVPWGLWRLALGARALGAARSLRFARVLGSGHQGGFGLAPSLTHQGWIALFDDEAGALAFARDSPCVQAARARAQESLLAVMRATSCRGSWGGVSLAVTAGADAAAPMASLTRASIRARHAPAFWRHAPAAQDGVRQAPGCRLAVGLGEAPLLRQATFSLWDSAAAMDAYAHSGAHQQAIDGAWRQGWFSESMFVRFAPIMLEGQWHGQRYG